MKFPLVRVDRDGRILYHSLRLISRLPEKKVDGLYRFYPSPFEPAKGRRLIKENFKSLTALYDLDLKLLGEREKEAYIVWLNGARNGFYGYSDFPDYLIQLSTSSNGGLHILVRLWDIPRALTNEQHRMACKRCLSYVMDDLLLPQGLEDFFDKSVWNINQGVYLFPFLKSDAVAGELLYKQDVDEVLALNRFYPVSITKPGLSFKTNSKIKKISEYKRIYLERLQAYVEANVKEWKWLLTKTYTSNHKGRWNFSAKTNTLRKFDTSDLKRFVDDFGSEALTEKGDSVHIFRLLRLALKNKALCKFLKINKTELKCVLEKDLRKLESELVENIVWYLAKKQPLEVILTANNRIKEIFEKFYFSFSIKHFRRLLSAYSKSFSRYGIEPMLKANYSKVLKLSYKAIDDEDLRLAATFVGKQKNPAFKARVRVVIFQLEKNGSNLREYICWLKHAFLSTQERSERLFFDLVSFYVSHKKSAK